MSSWFDDFGGADQAGSQHLSEASGPLKDQIAEMLRASIEDAVINVQIVSGSIRVIISGLPRWAAMVLASVVLGGATREPSTADPRPRSHTRRRVCAILHEHVTRLEYQKVPDVFVDGVQQILPQAPQFEKESEREPEPEADPEPELELEQQSEPELESQESHEFQVTVAVRKAEGEIDDDDNDANGAYSRRDFDDAWRESTPEDEVERVEQLLRQNGGRVSRQELLLHNIRTPDLTLEERHLRAPVGLQSLHTWLVKAQLGQLATQLQSVLPTDIYDLEKLRRTEVSDRCQTAGLDDSDTTKLLDAWDALVGTTKDSQAPNVIAEGVPPEHRIGGHSELEPEDDLHTRPPGPSAVIPSPVNRSVSLRWLKQFAAENRGKRFTFERREFTAPENGGGCQGGIDITADTLDAHRSARRAAETAGTGQPVAVRYADILFETMTTADVMEAIIRPVARAQHKSFAEAAIPLQATGSPTYFVSHA